MRVWFIAPRYSSSLPSYRPPMVLFRCGMVWWSFRVMRSFSRWASQFGLWDGVGQGKACGFGGFCHMCVHVSLLMIFFDGALVYTELAGERSVGWVLAGCVLSKLSRCRLADRMATTSSSISFVCGGLVRAQNSVLRCPIRPG